MRAVIGYTALLLAAYLLFLIATLPASVALGSAQVVSGRPLPVSVTNLTGTIWQGFADVQVNQDINPTVAWSIPFSSWLMGQFQLDWGLDDQDLELTGTASVSMALSGFIAVDGFVNAALLEKMAAQYEPTIRGQVKLENIEVALDGRSISAASGRVSWPGGPVNYKMMGARRAQTIQMPELLGAIEFHNEQLSLELTSAAGDSLASVLLKNDGWAQLKVKQRMVSLVMGAAAPGRGKGPETVAFEYEEKVF